MSRVRVVVAVLMAVATIASCGTVARGERADSSTAVSPGPVVEPGFGSPAGAHVDWVVSEALNAGRSTETISAADLAERFGDEFLRDGGRALRDMLEVVRQAGPWVVVEQGAAEHGNSAEVVLYADGQYLFLHSSVRDDGRAFVFMIGPAVDRSVDPTSVSDLSAVLAEIPASTAISVGHVSGGECVDQRTVGSATQSRLPVASVSKLLILDAVLSQVGEGALSWDSELLVDEALTSWTPSLESALAAGSKVSVAEAVRLMVAESDNTAADVLLEAVGRQVLDSAYMTDRETAQVPFWSTREVFVLAWQDQSGGAVDDLGGLGALRERIRSVPLDPSLHALTFPRWQDGFDWFMTPDELCDLGARLHARWDALPSAVRDELASRDYILRKHGGSPGVVAGLWLVDGESGAAVVTVQYASEDPSRVGDVSGLMGLGDSLASVAR